MQTIEHTAHVHEVIELAKESGYSRFPVTDGSSDEIKGVCHVKTIIAIPRDKRNGKEVGENKTPVIFVPETVHLDTLLVQLRSANLQMAIVLDEYGGTAGMVTLEDLIEEIVGEVADEHDSAPPEVRQLPDGSWMIPGMYRPDQLNELIGEVEIPDDAAYETLGGFVMAELGRIPFLGDVVDTEGGAFTVTALDKRRVAELHFVPRIVSASSASSASSAPSAASASSPDEAKGRGA
jgi:CBS domain containing-hemolysin-like protein